MAGGYVHINGISIADDFYHEQNVPDDNTGAHALFDRTLKTGIVVVRALSANQGKVYVGGEFVNLTNGWELSPGEVSIPFEARNASDVFIRVETQGDGVSVYAA